MVGGLMTPKLYSTTANSNFTLPMFGSPTALSAEQLKSMITRQRTEASEHFPCHHQDTFRHLQGWHQQRDEDLALPDWKQNLEARLCLLSRMNSAAMKSWDTYSCDGHRRSQHTRPGPEVLTLWLSIVCQRSDTDTTQRTTRLGCDTMGPAMWMT